MRLTTAFPRTSSKLLKLMAALVLLLSSFALTTGPASASTGDIVSIANANIGDHACDTNSAGGQGYYTSCTGAGGSPENWCADFAMWVWAQAGYDVSGLSPAAGSFGEYGSGLHSTPQVGDAVVFNYNGAGYADHVALVTAVNSDGTIQSVGGNEVTNDPSTSSVNSNTYDGTVGYSSYWGMNISGYVSPNGGGGGGGPSVSGMGRCDTSSNADCWNTAAGDGSDCHSGHFCIYTGPNYSGTVFSFYNCQNNGADWALQNWNGPGSYINQNTGGAVANIKDQNHNVLTATNPGDVNTSYDFGPAWYIQAC
ncbi:hypothetical protein ABH935_001025 [Catenulispora sp. GAS73]|uniref:CHAP domain-containing protein n=1 Tax=Catenulispora sp. GAS73 TaxID=3156269 RepID=UPI003511CF95